MGFEIIGGGGQNIVEKKNYDHTLSHQPTATTGTCRVQPGRQGLNYTTVRQIMTWFLCLQEA